MYECQAMPVMQSDLLNFGHIIAVSYYKGQKDDLNYCSHKRVRDNKNFDKFCSKNL